MYWKAIHGDVKGELNENERKKKLNKKNQPYNHDPPTATHKNTEGANARAK